MWWLAPIALTQGSTVESKHVIRAAIAERAMTFGRYIILILLVGLCGCVQFHERKLEPDKVLSSFENRSLEDSALQRFLATNQTSSTDEWHAPAKWDLETLTLVAFYYHPSLDLARAQWSSSKATIRTAAGRPNPTLGLLPGYDFTAAPGLPPWIPSVTYDMPIETAGKRRKRMERAQHLSTAARFNIISTAWQVRSALRTSLLDLVAAGQRQQAIQAQLQSEQAILQLMEQRLAAGAVAPAELYPARVAVLRTRADVIDLRRQLVDARARMADALGLPLKAIESLALDFPIDLPANWNELSAPEVRRTALQGRADLLGLIEEYEASQAALRVEIARQYPDVHLGSNYQWDQGENKWQLGVTFELPIFNQNQGPIAEAEAKRAEAATRFMALQAKAINEVDRALSTRQAVADQLKEAESLVQTHRELLSKLQGALAQGGADRVEVETAAVELRSSERTLLELKIKAQQAIGQLEDALQRPINAMRSVEQDPRSAAANTP